MRRIQSLVLRLSIIACLTVASLAVSSVAKAQCTGSNTCYGLDALASDGGWGNSAFGTRALRLNTFGLNNTAVGAGALSSNVGEDDGADFPSYGDHNTAIGAEALYRNTGGLNTATGAQALYSNTVGSGNTALGAESLLRNTTGRLNTATGVRALRGNGTGEFNTANGADALIGAWIDDDVYRQRGSGNTAMGASALASNDTGSSNTAIGSSALRGTNAITGSYNTASGASALQSNSTGTSNTASGYNALFSNSSGSNNTATGVNALRSNTTGIGNTATGYDALRSNRTGIRNTANGVGALYGVTTGYRNVALGFNAGKAVTTGSDNIIIGTETVGLAAENGVIRIGTGTYQKKAFVAGIRGVKTGSTGAVAVLIDANGQLGTINSSRRFKQDIQTMGSVSEKLYGLRPVTFRYKEAYDDGSKPMQYGLIAEEVAEVFPELVVYSKDGKPETVSYHLLATLLLNEVQKEHRVMQAQSERIASLEKQTAELAALKSQVASMAKVIERLDRQQMVASAM